MAIGKASDFLIKDDFFIGSFTETVAQNLDVFNENSNGALVLESEQRRGHYFYETFYKEISSFDVRRDITSTSTLTPAALTQDELVSVKLNRRQGPMEHTIDAFRKQGNSPEEMSVVLGEQSAKALLQAYLHRALRAVVASLDGTATLKHDATDGTIAMSDFVTGMSKLQDNLNGIACVVMHDKPFYDAFTDQLSNFKIDTVAGALIARGVPGFFGKPVVVTRDTALVNTDGITSGTDSYYTLLLQEMAVKVEESEVSTLHTFMGDNKENITVGWQFEYAFNLAVRGFKWDVGNGGANPTDTALSTTSYWDQAYTDVRNLAGAIIESQ